MKKLPEVTINDWLAAEEKVRQLKTEPQPKGSVTVEQYSEMNCNNGLRLSISHAQKRLANMVKAGLAERRRWCNGNQGTKMVYWLKK